MLKKLLFLLLICVPSIVQSFTTFDILVKDRKLILILGDSHNVELDAFNRASVQLFIAETQKVRTDKTIDCFIEVNKQVFEYCKNANDSELLKIQTAVGEGGTFLELAKTRFKNNILNFQTLEVRGAEAQALYSIMYAIESIIGQVTSNLKDKDNKFNFQQLKSSLRSHIFNTQLSLGQYRTILKANYSKVKGLLKSLKENGSKYLDIIKSYAIQYGKALQEIIHLFKDENDKKTFQESLIDLFKNCSTLEDANNKYKEIDDLLSFRSDVIFADIFFFYTLMQNHEFNSKTIFIVGNRHAKSLVKMALENGYKNLFSDTCHRNSVKGTYYCINQNFVNKLEFINRLVLTIKDQDIDSIENLINNFNNQSSNSSTSLANSMQQLSVQEQQEDETQILCNACNKDLTQEANKQRCSRCKQVYYCNVDCQKADWKKHKNTCVTAE